MLARAVLPALALMTAGGCGQSAGLDATPGPPADLAGVADLGAPDMAGVDLVLLDLTMPDLTMPDLTMPDGAMPDLVVTDLAMPDLAIADLAMPDFAKPDFAMPDFAKPDFAMPDFAMPDLAQPDLVLPDLAKPDLAKPDLAMPDLAKPDLATSPDLKMKMSIGAGPFGNYWLCQITSTTVFGDIVTMYNGKFDYTTVGDGKLYDILFDFNDFLGLPCTLGADRPKPETAVFPPNQKCNGIDPMTNTAIEYVIAHGSGIAPFGLSTMILDFDGDIYGKLQDAGVAGTFKTHYECVPAP